jgi:hypothetical protein
LDEPLRFDKESRETFDTNSEEREGEGPAEEGPRILGTEREFEEGFVVVRFIVR